VANSLRLLTLPRDVQKFLESNDITIGHARALIPSKIASELVKIVIAKKLNVRETEKLVYSTEISENKIATVSHKNLSPLSKNF
jgi:ParB family chromosome partitioning protein